MATLLDLFYAATLLPHYAYHRAVTGKYGPDAPEKLGRLPVSVTRGPDAAGMLWIHGVSVGETLAARPLVQGFARQRPDWAIRLSTTTATGREVARKHFGAENVFYYPLDLSACVRRAFDAVRPDLVLLMELEVWPQLLAEAERRGVPVVVANVRITDRSVQSFRRFGGAAERMLRRVSLWLSQNEAYAAALRGLGVEEERIRVVGSLKYDGLSFDCDPAAGATLREELGGGRIFLAGSTHAGEEEAVYAAFRALRESVRDLRLVLVPRHPERCDAVERIAPAGLQVVRRSRGAAPPQSDVVLGDVMGELGALYRAADVAFVGGTFDPAIGGHNVLEPAAAGVPVVFGPALENVREPADHLEGAGGAVRLASPDADALVDALEPLLTDPDAAGRMGRQARDAAGALQGAAERTIAEIETLLDGRRGG